MAQTSGILWLTREVEEPLHSWIHLSAGTGAPCPSQMGCQAHSCISSSRYVSLSPSLPNTHVGCIGWFCVNLTHATVIIEKSSFEKMFPPDWSVVCLLYW